MRPNLWKSLLLICAPMLVFADVALCQLPPDPPGLPSEPPVREVEAFWVPIQWIYPSPQATGGWAASGVDQVLPNPLPANGVARLLIARPRHRPISSTNLPPERSEFGGRVWKNGHSRMRINPAPYRGWFLNYDRVDCAKGWASSASDFIPPTVRVRYEGEEHFTMVGPGSGGEHVYIAEYLDLAFRGGAFIGARWEVDYGTGCVPAYGGAHACTNPACARFGVCAEPWVYPNDPCTTCGVPGRDATALDFFRATYSTWNMLPGAGPNPWEQTTPRPSAMNATATVAQANSTGGTPYLSAQLIQLEAVSTDGPYQTPTRLVQAYDDGVYFVFVDRVKLRRSSMFDNGVRAELRMRMWRLWTFDSAGVFSFLGDWFSTRAECDLDGDQCVAAGDIFTFLTAWFAR